MKLISLLCSLFTLALMSASTSRKLPVFFSKSGTFKTVHGNPDPGKKGRVTKNRAIHDIIDAIIREGNQLMGKPYRYPVENNRKLDCSGFVSYIYSKLGYQLSYSCPAIAQEVVPIKTHEIRKGDLMFFKGSNKGSDAIGHVVMVTSAEGGDIEFIHSCSRGIITEKYKKNKYYLDRFLFAGRFPAFQAWDGKSAEEVQTSVNAENSGETAVSIIGVGDIMLGSAYPDNSGLPPADGKEILLPVADILKRADLTFGNLEGVLLSGEGHVKQCKNPSVCYAFKSPEHYVNHLKTAGFDLLSVANNHVHDFGKPGISATMKTLDTAGIHYAGLLACPTRIFTAKGLRFGFAAFAPNNGTVSINDLDKARKIVSSLNESCDIVIVSFHGGAEGSGSTHVTRKQEDFLGENRGNPYRFARVVIDAGADVVFGHGPHVTRAIDLYKDRFIAYSLGNFATYGKFNLSGPCGLAPIAELNLDASGAFVSGKIHSVKQRKPGGPVPDPDSGALKEIIRLTRADLPECPLLIEEDGNISKKGNPDKN